MEEESIDENIEGSGTRVSSCVFDVLALDFDMFSRTLQTPVDDWQSASTGATDKIGRVWIIEVS